MYMKHQQQKSILSLYLHIPFTIINEMQEKIDVLLDLFEPEELTDIPSYFNRIPTVFVTLLFAEHSGLEPSYHYN